MKTNALLLLCVALLPTVMCSSPGPGQSGIYPKDSIESKSFHSFGFWSLGCDPSVSWTEATFSITESLFVSVAIVDSLQDTVYSFGTRRLPPGNYEIIWLFSDREIDSLPVWLWLQLAATWSPKSQLAAQFSASVPFCAPK